MKKDIEVELRGRLTHDDRDQLIEIFKHDGKYVTTKERIMIDYSTFLEGEGIRDRQKDIRLRMTNGVPEIMIKLGPWGGVDQRKELSVTTEPGTFNTLVEIFAALGFLKGMMCQRNSVVYEYKGIEFSMVEVPHHSWYFEADKMVHERDILQATEEVTRVCNELGLEVFSKEDFFAYIETLNKEANTVFDFNAFSAEYHIRHESLRD